jgi:hypothetical protein
MQAHLIVACLVIADGGWIGNWIYRALKFLTASNFNSLTGLLTVQITVTTTHTKSSLICACWQITTMSSASSQVKVNVKLWPSFQTQKPKLCYVSLSFQAGP